MNVNPSADSDPDPETVQSARAAIRAKREARAALASRAAEQGAAARNRVVALLAESGPVQPVRLAPGAAGLLEPSLWPDPEDLNRFRRAQPARQISGFRAANVLRRMANKSALITPAHLAAGAEMARLWDVARLGLSPGGVGLAPGRGPAGAPQPRFGPPAAEMAREAAARELRRCLRHLGSRARMAVWFVLAECDLNGWCRAEERRTGRALNPQTAFGSLVAVLDFLADYFGEVVRREGLE